MIEVAQDCQVLGSRVLLDTFKLRCEGKMGLVEGVQHGVVCITLGFATCSARCEPRCLLRYVHICYKKVACASA